MRRGLIIRPRGAQELLCEAPTRRPRGAQMVLREAPPTRLRARVTRDA
jgi:hypothetical protein